MRRLADLLEGVESRTPYGGQSVSWELIGTAWLRTGAVRRRERRDPAGVRIVETLTAEARSDPRLIAGRVLRFDGADWRIAGAETVGGQTILTLERTP